MHALGLLIGSCLTLTAAAAEFHGATPLDWSKRMADSEIRRLGDSLFHENPSAKWTYTTGLLGEAYLKLADATGNAEYGKFGARAAESFIGADGAISRYKLDEYNIDLVTPGKILLYRWQQGHRPEANRIAIETLRRQMREHPRTQAGGFWHKKKYPHQMWLDGLYMASPFLADYAGQFNEPALYDEVVKQLMLVDEATWDPVKKLHLHAWDEARQQPWADKQTGRSPTVWGRAVGWYAMALVDDLGFLPADHPGVPKVKEILTRVADGISRHQDPASGLWYQVLDQEKREGNYLEATASSMFVYSLAKAVHHGWLPREKYLPVVLKGYEGITGKLIRTDADGSIHLTRCCEVAGLGGMNLKGTMPRDGSYAYYLSEPVVENDHKGVGPFMLAGIELTAISDQSQGARGWEDLEAVLARIKPPVFPDKDFPITDFGAKRDTDCTTAIRSAIEACHKDGGGRVLVPEGRWLTGAIKLLSNVNLQVIEGATLEWTFNLDDYPLVFTRFEGMECMNFSPLIYAFGQENIAITGKGTLDGGATNETWWGWNPKDPELRKKGPSLQKKDRDALGGMMEKSVPPEQRVFGKGHHLRPNFIQPYQCRNILIEGVTILRSPMWEIHLVLSQNITVRGVTINSHGPNNDGCDPESCRDVLIENTVFDTGDDCIAIKSGRNEDGRRIHVPSENIVIRHCTMKDGHGGVVLGSECSGHIRNVWVEDCVMDSPNLDRALRFKNNADRGGILENVFMRRVRIGQVAEAALTIDLLYEEGPEGGFQAIVRNVEMSEITSAASPRVMFIRGYDGAIIDNIRIIDSKFDGVTHTEVLEHAGDIRMRNVDIVPASGLKTRNTVPRK
jgi:unsaturated rhamnogalacturonyl hydrolase